MDALECIYRRRSVRKYAEGKVKDEDLKKILEAAIMAPSAGNLQPWKFYIVRNINVKRELTRAAYNQEFIYQADVCIVVVAIPEISAKVYGERGEKLYCIQDTAAAVQNILLASKALGYGTCWVGAFNESMAREILHLPPNERPVAMIPIGIPAEDPPPRKRKRDVFVFIN